VYFQAQSTSSHARRQQSSKKLSSYNKSMKIKKLGHCCLVIEENGVKVMTDPGSFSSGMDAEEGIARWRVDVVRPLRLKKGRF
jgi:hypothetical protein